MDGTEFNLRFRQTMQKVHGELCGMAEQVAEIRAAESANASADPRVSMYMTMAILCLEMGRDLLGELGHKQPAIRVHLCIETIFSTFGVPLEEVYGASSGSVRAGSAGENN